MNDIREEFEQRERTRSAEREDAVDRVKQIAGQEFDDLHPVHRARAYRELQQHASEEARSQENTNTEKGIPE